MKLKNLFETAKLDEEKESKFIKLLNKETLEDVKTIDEAFKRIKIILDEADKYAEKMNLEKKYLEKAKRLIFEELEVEPETFIVHGFDAKVIIDLSEGLNAKPFVKVYNQKINMISDEEKYEINESFLNTLNVFQREGFNEAIHKLEEKTLDLLKKSWKLEKKRLEKWIKETPIKIKG